MSIKIKIEYYLLNVLCWIKLRWCGIFWLLIIIMQLVNAPSSWIIRRIISGCLVLLELTHCRIPLIFKEKLVVHILKRLEIIYLSDLTIDHTIPRKCLDRRKDFHPGKTNGQKHGRPNRPNGKNTFNLRISEIPNYTTYGGKHLENNCSDVSKDNTV